MAEIFPFPAVRYNLERVRLADVVTQPYDKITPAMQQRYAQGQPVQFDHRRKGQPTPDDSPANNVYTRAAAALNAWIAKAFS